jgi:hypothetical protein
VIADDARELDIREASGGKRKNGDDQDLRPSVSSWPTFNH